MTGHGRSCAAGIFIRNSVLRGLAARRPLENRREERIRVTSNIGGVHSLKAHGFNPLYRRIEKSRRPHMEFAHGL